jgi:lipoprotein-releasing system permease protein
MGWRRVDHFVLVAPRISSRLRYAETRGAESGGVPHAPSRRAPDRLRAQRFFRVVGLSTTAVDRWRCFRWELLAAMGDSDRRSLFLRGDCTEVAAWTNVHLDEAERPDLLEGAESPDRSGFSLRPVPTAAVLTSAVSSARKFGRLRSAMRALLFLLRRYLFPHRGGLLPFALWLAVLGVMLGVAQLVVTLAIMSGFEEVLKDSYVRISSHVVVVPRSDRQVDPAFASALRKTPGVLAVTPTILAQGMAIHDGAVGGVVLEGIDLDEPTPSGKVTDWNGVWQSPPLSAPNATPWIWLGVQLAKKLGVRPGDTVDVLLPDREGETTVKFFVAAVTRFGIYDHDLRYARVDRRLVEKLFQREGYEPMWKLRVEPGRPLEPVADALREALGPKVQVKLWSDVNQNIFLAVQHQKKMLFLVLVLVVGLAAVNVINLLLMSAHQRRRDVAILRAMGFPFRSVFAFFLFQGGGAGCLGIGGGVALGAALVAAIARWKPTFLSEAIYNVRELPVRMRIEEVSLVAAVALALCLLLSAIPALRAALDRPAEALRHD